MATKKNVLYLRSDLVLPKTGGSVAHTKGILGALKKKGYKIYFACADIFEGLFDKNYILIPGKFFRYLFYGVGSFVYNYFGYLIFRLNKNKYKFDYVYTRYSLYSDLPVRVAKLFKIPLILEYNGSEVWVARNWHIRIFSYKVAEIMEKRCLDAASLIIVVSNALRDDLILRGVSTKKILVSENGVDIDEYDVRKLNKKKRKKITNEYRIGSKKVIGFIGTFGLWHGTTEIVEAAKILVEKYRDVIFLMVGDGVTAKKVIKLIKAYELEKYFVLTGQVHQEDGKYYVSLFDIALNPTVPNEDGTEFIGSPTKIFEYLSLERPLVTSNVGQMGKIFSNKENAILYDPSDRYGLSRSIEILLRDEKLRKKIAKNGRKLVKEKYSWDKNIERMEKFMKINKI